MTPLRQRMLDDLRLRNFTPGTQRAYIYNVACFANHFHTSPDLLDFEHVRSYLLSLIERKLSWTYFNQVLCSLRFCYTITLGREWPVLNLVCAKVPQKLPAVLGREEIAAFLGCIDDLKHLAILSTLYAAGLRSLELAQLQVTDVDSRRMVLRLLGKGQKERLVPLSPELLTLLRNSWRIDKPTTHLFSGQKSIQAFNSYLNRLCDKYARKAGLRKHVSAPRHMDYGTPMPLISTRTASSCLSCKCSWDTDVSKPPCVMCVWPSPLFVPRRARTICSRDFPRFPPSRRQRPLRKAASHDACSGEYPSQFAHTGPR